MAGYDNNNPYYGGGGGGGGGGGFVGGTTGSPYGSQGSPSGGGKGKGGSSTLRPVTIMQINNAQQPHPDADFSIDGADVGSVSVVGVVRNIATMATNTTYHVEDGTGSIEAKVWLDSADDSSGKTAGVEQDVYVALMGPIKSFQGKRQIAAQSVRRITDLNEVFYHLLESLHVSLSFRNPAVNKSSDEQKAQQSDYAMGNTGGNGGGGGGDSERWSELPPLHRTIMETVGGLTESDDGVHVANIAKTLGGQGDAIMDAIEWLITEGQLYTTMDEMHVKIV